MPKPFGQYLLENGVVDLQSLLEALIEQQEHTPTPASIVFKHKLLPADKLFAVLNLQNERSIGFRDSCRALGLWTDDIESRVMSAVNQARRPLGQILVMRGKATFQDITKALDQYVWELTRGKDGGAGSVQPAIEMARLASGIFFGVNKQKPHGGDLRTALFNEYFKMLSDDRFKELEETFESWPVLFGKSLKKSVEGVLGGFSEIAAAARFIQAFHSQQLIDAMAALLEAMAEHVEKMSRSRLEHVGTALMDGLELLWKIRHFMEMDLSENGFWGEAPQRGRYDKIVQSLVKARDGIVQDRDPASGNS